MRVLLVHPSGLMYSESFLRLEPLGLERVVGAASSAGHQVRLLDLQAFRRDELSRELREFAPDAVGFSLNYLDNIPEVIDLAHLVKTACPGCLVFAGGHSVLFMARHVLDQAGGAIDAIARGAGEVIIPQLLAAAGDGRLHHMPGVITADGAGPAPPARRIGLAGALGIRSAALGQNRGFSRDRRHPRSVLRVMLSGWHHNNFARFPGGYGGV